MKNINKRLVSHTEKKRREGKRKKKLGSCGTKIRRDQNQYNTERLPSSNDKTKMRFLHPRWKKNSEAKALIWKRFIIMRVLKRITNETIGCLIWLDVYKKLESVVESHHIEVPTVTGES